MAPMAAGPVPPGLGPPDARASSASSARTAWLSKPMRPGVEPEPGSLSCDAAPADRTRRRAAHAGGGRRSAAASAAAAAAARPPPFAPRSRRLAAAPEPRGAAAEAAARPPPARMASIFPTPAQRRSSRRRRLDRRRRRGCPRMAFQSSDLWQRMAWAAAAAVPRSARQGRPRTQRSVMATAAAAAVTAASGRSRPIRAATMRTLRARRASRWSPLAQPRGRRQWPRRTTGVPYSARGRWRQPGDRGGIDGHAARAVGRGVGVHRRGQRGAGRMLHAWRRRREGAELCELRGRKVQADVPAHVVGNVESARLPTAGSRASCSASKGMQLHRHADRRADRGRARLARQLRLPRGRHRAWLRRPARAGRQWHDVRRARRGWRLEAASTSSTPRRRSGRQVPAAFGEATQPHQVRMFLRVDRENRVCRRGWRRCGGGGD